MAATVAVSFGTVDVLADNAGSRIVKSFLKCTEGDGRRMLDVNLTRHFLRQQADRATHPEGRWWECRRHLLHRRGSRTAEAHRLLCGQSRFFTFTKALTVDLSDNNVWINAVSPSMIETPMNQVPADDPDAGEKWKSQNLAGRWGQPEDVAKAAVFLASEDSGFMTSAMLQAEGGAISAYIRAGEMERR